MAYSVTPTSGAGPYTFTAEFLNKASLFADLYQLEVRLRTGTGSCPAPATTGSRSMSAEQSILNTDNYVAQSTIPSGSCFVSTILIRNTVTGDIVSQQFADIDNVE